MPQTGHDGEPEVLVRLQSTVLGMGAISAPNDADTYLWRPHGFNEAQATIALLWPALGPVKRAQAAAAMRIVHDQYASGRYEPRGPRPRRRPHVSHDEPAAGSAAARELDLAWAAGFLDAEGCFGTYRALPRKKGPPWRRIRMSASQHGDLRGPPEALRRLQRVVGAGRIERHGEADDYKWLVEGPERIRHALSLVRPWLGPVKSEQARRSLDAFDAQVRLKGTVTHCVRGHPYTRMVTRSGRPRKICSACDRIRDRAERARKGIKPRQFKNVARRYTF